MRQQGKVVRWNDEQGFGFIVPKEGGDDVFVHVTSFVHRHLRKPVENDAVSYEVTPDKDGRLRAENVLIDGQKQPRKKRSPVGNFNFIFVAFFMALLIVLTFADRIPTGVLSLYMIMSAVTWTSYVLDKSAAIRGKWRTPEKTLHMLDLLCGWPGGLIAQALFRHKTSKRSFLVTTWVVVILNCTILLWAVLPQGNNAIQSLPRMFDSGKEKLPAKDLEDPDFGIQITPQ